MAHAQLDDAVGDELERYLAVPVIGCTDALEWWSDRRTNFPHLSRMALNYLSIPGTSFCVLHSAALLMTISPATSVDVERVFSRSRLVLPYVRNQLTAQSTRTILCLSSWSLAGYAAKDDVKDVAEMSDVEGEGSDYEMEDGWDAIDTTWLERCCKM